MITRNSQARLKRKNKFSGLQKRKICGNAKYIMTRKIRQKKMHSNLNKKEMSSKRMGDFIRRKITRKETSN